MKILNVVGARPNFIKIAPLVREIRKARGIEQLLVHTGQHYDYEMSRVFFEDLEIPQPDIHLEVGSGTHAKQTAKIMDRFEEVIIQTKPDLILVVGDVNSTLACSLVASKMNIKIAHVEAGLRSFDKSMPEEINRIITDTLSNYLFIHSLEARINLRNEGVSEKKIFFVGNIMIDTLIQQKEKIESLDIINKYGLEKNNYAVLTLHRPSNVDNHEKLTKVFQTLRRLQRQIKIFFPVHPRTLRKMEEFNLKNSLNMDGLIMSKPLSYLKFLNIMKNCRLVVTDSGGVQEESTYLGIPCLTLRENTERPVTITEGTNTLVGSNSQNILKKSQEILKGKYKEGRIPKFWDGKTANRIVKILVGYSY
jgi:UDP-N-acetylglucosamine 2-epimerase (non-hydrolysing)